MILGLRIWFTSPRRGEVDLRSKSGEGAPSSPKDRNPSPGAARRPLPMGEVNFRCGSSST